jgi:hypothetical protein
MYFAFCNAVHRAVTVWRKPTPAGSSFAAVERLSRKPILAAGHDHFRLPLPQHRPAAASMDRNPPIADDPEAYQSVQCVACSQLHWVNPTTGRVLEPTNRSRRF